MLSNLLSSVFLRMIQSHSLSTKSVFMTLNACQNLSIFIQEKSAQDLNRQLESEAEYVSNSDSRIVNKTFVLPSGLTEVLPSILPSWTSKY